MHLMRTTSTLFMLALSTGLLASCTLADQVKGTGPLVRKAVTVDAFHGVALMGALDVMITKGAAQRVEVEAQANIAELVELEVREGICHISTKESYTTSKPFIVHITLPALDHVEVAGSGDVTSTTPFTMDAMQVKVSGSGDVALSVQAGPVQADLSGSGEIKLIGTAKSLDATVKGSGDIKAGNLIVATATTRVTGSGDITVQAGTLNATITGSGDVKYKGNKPAITSKITGSGSVRHVDE